MTKKEPVQRVAERTVLLMQQWAMDVEADWRHFWQEVSTTQALHWIRTGKLSPWVLLATTQGKGLLDRFDEKQLQDVTGYIEIDPWRIRMARNKEDCRWLQGVFDQIDGESNGTV
jgi:hypothetical protein